MPITLASLPNPAPMYLLGAKIAIVAAVCAALYGAGYYHASQKGEESLIQQAVAAQAKYDSILSAYNVMTEKANGIAATNSAVLDAGVKGIAANLNKENQNAKNVPAKPLVLPSVGCFSLSPSAKDTADKGKQYPGFGLQGNGNSAASTGTGEKAQCRLDDATGKALYEITQDGDAAIRQLNAVIDAYNLVQKIGCSVTPAKKEELDALLNGTELKRGDVAEPDTPVISVQKLKDGVFGIFPALDKP